MPTTSIKHQIVKPHSIITIRNEIKKLERGDSLKLSLQCYPENTYLIHINDIDSYKVKFKELIKLLKCCDTYTKTVLTPFTQNTKTPNMTVDQLKKAVLVYRSTFNKNRGYGKNPLKKGKADTISKQLENIVKNSSATTQTIRDSLQELLSGRIQDLINHTSPTSESKNSQKHAATLALRDSINELLITSDPQDVFFRAEKYLHMQTPPEEAAAVVQILPRSKATSPKPHQKKKQQQQQ